MNERDDPAAIELVLGELLLETTESRCDPKKFFEFVLKDEKGQPIELPPHQRVVIDFMVAHDKGVILLPRGHAKSWGAAGMILWWLGLDPMLRIAFFGAAETQAKQTLGMIRDYIEASAELRGVFPGLRRGQGDWTDDSLTVARPHVARHPSVQAFGIGSERIRGNRLDIAFIDDVLSEENAATPEAREKIHLQVQGKILPTIEPKRGKVFFLNTAWHPDDTVHRHMRSWPTLIMKVDGTILLQNTDWDTPDIVPADERPATDPNATYRLAAHEPDPEHRRTLWEERFPPEKIEEIRADMHPLAFAQNYLNECRDDASSLCKQEYIDKAIEVARQLGIESLVPAIDPQDFPYPIFVGVDLAFSKEAASDECCLFVLAVLPDAGRRLVFNGKTLDNPHPIRVPLWIEHGRWGTAELYERMLRINDTFHPWAFSFENNAAQEGVRQLLVTADKTLVLKPHTTDATKNSIALGVPSIFGEMANGAWAIPKRPGRPLEAPVQKFVDQCLAYTPAEHTGDILMAGYFARGEARKFGVLARAGSNATPQNLAGNLLAR